MLHMIWLLDDLVIWSKVTSPSMTIWTGWRGQWQKEGHIYNVILIYKTKHKTSNLAFKHMIIQVDLWLSLYLMIMPSLVMIVMGFMVKELSDHHENKYSFWMSHFQHNIKNSKSKLQKWKNGSLFTLASFKTDVPLCPLPQHLKTEIG